VNFKAPPLPAPAALPWLLSKALSAAGGHKTTIISILPKTRLFFNRRTLFSQF
jgi:hypothetical protein